MPEHQSILLVEDDRSAAELLTFILRGEEYDVVHASDGDSALALAHRRRPGVVLLDLELPYVDGREFLKRLRAEPALASVPVVVVSGAEDAAEIGADAVVKKPLEKAQLLRVLREVFRFVPPGASDSGAAGGNADVLSARRPSSTRIPVGVPRD